MAIELSKTYNSKAVEKRIYDSWNRPAASRASSTPKRSPSPSQCRPPTSPASCTWATPLTTPCRTCWHVSRECRATPPCGSPAPTTPPSPPRRRSWKPCARKACPRLTWAAKSSWSGHGSGRRPTATASPYSCGPWAAPATGPATTSPWTSSAPRPCWKSS